MSTAKCLRVMCGNILGGTEKRSGPPGLCATGVAHGCPERATIHLIYATSVHRRRPFKSKQSPRGRRGGVSCTLCYKNFFAETIKNYEVFTPARLHLQKGFLHKQWSRTVH